MQNIKVSFYKDVQDTVGKPSPLARVLDAIKTGNKGKWIPLIQYLRGIQDEAEQKKYKNTLPCYTPSGVFSNRKTDELIAHSNRLIIDIDMKDNPILLEKFNEIRKQLIADKYTCFLFTSCRGNGMAGGVKIDGAKHTETFQYLEHYYREKHGLTIDKGCKDVTRLRYISYDPDLYLNDSAETVIVPPDFLKEQNRSHTMPIANGKNHEILRGIIAGGRLIGDDSYDCWYRIGLALANEFGEEGRAYFHELSKVSPKYNAGECDRKYDNCLRTNRGKVTFGTVTHLAREAGIVSERMPKECDKPNSTMVLTRLDSLFQEPEETTTWLVDGLLPSGGFSVAVAKPKVGKSTTVRTLALHVAKGESFIGRGVVKGVVIYLALEEKRSEVKKHFRDMGATGNEEIHIYTGGAPVDAIKQIREATELLKPVLVIIDPLFRLTKVKDGNDYIQVTNALDPLLRLARDTGTHVLCIHHSPKGERSAEDCILGSQAIFGSVDTLIVMKRHEHYRTIQTIQRYGQDLEETILNFDKETRLITIGGTREQESLNLLKNLIIEFLLTQNEPVTEATINQNVEGTIKFKCKALRELVAENKINREGKGSKGNPYKYSTILLRSICVEVEKENLKKTGNPHGCQGYSTSQDFDSFEESEKSREVESLVKNEDKNYSQKPIVNAVFKVENMEVE
jgi:hypothetical protein